MLGLVPALGVADVSEAEIVLLGPEERHRVKPLALTEHVARGSLPLAFGHHPVFDADALAGEPVRPARNVAGREDARDARLEVFVHGDAAIDGEACLFRQCDHRPYADADDDKIGLKIFSTLQTDALLVYGDGCGAEMERHTVALVELADEPSDVRSQDFLHRNGIRRDHMHVDIARAQRCRHLESDEARADHHRSL